MLLEAVLTGAVRGGTSILYATLGETVAERSGTIYLGIEGSMLCGALAAYIVGVETGNPYLGVLAGVLAGALLAAIHAAMVLWRRANQFATGLVVTFLAIGLTALFGQDYVGTGVEPLPQYAVPGLSDLPFVGRVLFQHDLLTYLSFVVAPALWWVFYRTRIGITLRSAGERPEVLRTYGTSPQVVRTVALLVAGALAGLGGAQLSTAFARNWSENMTAGRGFVAVALVIFAAWNPIKAMGGAYLFSGAIALQLQLQARGWEISRYLLEALPYLLVVVVLALLSRRRVGTEPEALNHVFHETAV
jgi:simple sugar transport system permease protein